MHNGFLETQSELLARPAQGEGRRLVTPALDPGTEHFAGQLGAGRERRRELPQRTIQRDPGQLLGERQEERLGARGRRDDGAPPPPGGSFGLPAAPARTGHRG